MGRLPLERGRGMLVASDAVGPAPDLPLVINDATSLERIRDSI